MFPPHAPGEHVLFASSSFSQLSVFLDVGPHHSTLCLLNTWPPPCSCVLRSPSACLLKGHVLLNWGLMPIIEDNLPISTAFTESQWQRTLSKYDNIPGFQELGLAIFGDHSSSYCTPHPCFHHHQNFFPNSKSGAKTFLTQFKISLMFCPRINNSQNDWRWNQLFSSKEKSTLPNRPWPCL